MGSTGVEKTAEELRKEIEELQRQQWEITERLRDPRGLRRGNFAANGLRSGTRLLGRVGPQRGYIRPSDRVDSEDQPAQKRRLSSAVVKVEDGEFVQGSSRKEEQDVMAEGEAAVIHENDKRERRLAGSRRDGNQRAEKADIEAQSTGHVPRILPKDEDPSLVKRNRRMLGQLLGTLEKFQEEDKHLSATEAYMRRSDSLRRAEQRAREESERLRQQEREQLAEKRRRDLTLRARVAAKAEEKKLELLFIRWTEHHKRLCNFLRTKAVPPIYYLPNKPLEEAATLVEQQKEQVFMEWKTARREEFTEYQKQIGEQFLANVEAELERWQNARNMRRANNAINLQETMDKELETHRREHGPKTTLKIPRGGEDEEDVEDVGEDDMMDDVLEVEDNGARRPEDASKLGTGNASPSPDGIESID